MSSSSDFARLYGALGCKPGCTWEEVRKGYRRQAQAWHPDRFPEASPERAEAEKRIVLINRAYQALAAYWKRFGDLPGQVTEQQKAERAKSRVRKRTPRPKSRSQPITVVRQTETAKTAHPSHNQSISLVTLVFLCIAVYGFLYWKSGQPLDGALHSSGSRLESHSYTTPTSHEIPDLVHDEEGQIYFTVGSTMSKVHELQGIPTRMEGQTWYYGDSKVHFVDGLVASWESSPNNPLYALQTFNGKRKKVEPGQQGD